MGPTRHSGAPWWVVGLTGISSTASQLYKYPKIPETLGESRHQSFHRRKFQNHEIQLEPFSGTLPEGTTIAEGFFIITLAPPMMRE